MSKATDAFTAGPPTISAAKELVGTAEKTLLTLVKALETEQQRAHLEAMGLAGLGKVAKKAARKAAYRLKSKGVEGEVVPEAAYEFSVDINLDEAVLIGLPGLRGNYFAVATEMPGAQAFRLQLEGQEIDASILEPVSPGRLKKIRRSMEDSNDGHAFLLSGAAMAVRAIDAVGRDLEIRETEAPESWPFILQWKEYVVGQGVDAAGSCSRTALADELAGISDELKTSTARLLDDDRLGPPVPPDGPVDNMMKQIGEAVHGTDEITEEAFRAKLESFANETVDAWLMDANEQAKLKNWLDFGADCFHAWGDTDAALQLLWTADQLGAEVLPHEVDLLRQAFVELIDFDQAWQHLQEFLEDPEAHKHHHGHNHE